MDEVKPNDKGHYYVKDGMVWKDSIETKHEGGSSFTIGFPVAKMHDAVGAEAAETVAKLMSMGDASTDLCEALKAMFDRWEPDCTGTDRVMWEAARAALARAALARAGGGE